MTSLELAEVHDAPRPFKWIRIKSDNPALETSTKLRLAQNDKMLQNSLNTLLDRQVDSSDGAVKLN